MRRPALHQFGVEPVFERLDLMTHRPLRDMQFGGGKRDALVPRHCLETRSIDSGGNERRGASLASNSLVLFIVYSELLDSRCEFIHSIQGPLPDAFQ